MWDSIVAVAGTLAGGMLAVATQQLTDRRTRAEAHRIEVSGLIADLLAAVLGYRELYWLRVDSLRAGEPDPVQRAAIYRARSAVTQARDRLALSSAAPSLLEAAREAVRSALELSDITLGEPVAHAFATEVEAALAAGRDRSRDAHTVLRRAGTAYANAGLRCR